MTLERHEGYLAFPPRNMVVNTRAVETLGDQLVIGFYVRRSGYAAPKHPIVRHLGPGVVTVELAEQREEATWRKQ